MFFEGEIKNVLQVGLDEFYVGKYLYTTVEWNSIHLKMESAFFSER